MNKTLTLLIASTALTAALGIPAWSAMHAPAQTDATGLLSTLLGAGDDGHKLILVDDDEDDDDEGRAGMNRRNSGDDEEDDEECDDDEGSCGAAAAPAPAGSVAPPKNGLFGTGTPQVQVK